MTRIPLILWLSFVTALTLSSSRVVAQQMPSVDGRYFPLNQMSPPGTAAEWAARLGRTTPEYFQPVRVSLPTSGTITFYEGSHDRSYDLPAPGQASLIVGRIYRLRISGLPEFPGAEFFPSVELIDRLHPPAGKVEDFPIEFEFTEEELLWAAQGRLITKVVYLEQPSRVPTDMIDAKLRIKTIEPHRNAIAEADQLGRPLAIVRMGGRTPDPNRPEPEFFGPGGPIRVSQKATEIGSRRRSDTAPREALSQSGVVRIGPRAASRMAQR